MTDALLRIRGLGFAYADSPVFHDWSADIGPGLTFVVGDENAGKTTLLKLLAGRLAFTGSIAWVGGEALIPVQVAWHDSSADRVPVREFLAPEPSRKASFDLAALTRHVDGFGLTAHLDKAFYQLSTGTRRKVLLAATLAAGARVTLLDEPTAALDADSVAHLMRVLASDTTDPARAWIVTGYAAPPGMPGARILELPPSR